MNDESRPWPKRIGAITLFTEDLAATRDFYATVFGVPMIFEDERLRRLRLRQHDHQPAEGHRGPRVGRARRRWAG